MYYDKSFYLFPFPRIPVKPFLSHIIMIIVKPFVRRAFEWNIFILHAARGAIIKWKITSMIVVITMKHVRFTQRFRENNIISLCSQYYIRQYPHIKRIYYTIIEYYSFKLTYACKIKYTHIYH